MEIRKRGGPDINVLRGEGGGKARSRIVLKAKTTKTMTTNNTERRKDIWKKGQGRTK